jgi:hypothetical protein
VWSGMNTPPYPDKSILVDAVSRATAFLAAGDPRGWTNRASAPREHALLLSPKRSHASRATDVVAIGAGAVIRTP